MKKLITGAIVAAALAVPATPAFAIHDPNVPGENWLGWQLPGNSQAIGHPAARVQGTPAVRRTPATPASGWRNTNRRRPRPATSSSKARQVTGPGGAEARSHLTEQTPPGLTQ